MNRPTELNVTEQTVDLSKLTDQHWSYYETLTNELIEKYEQGGRGRQIFTLSGPPGSGKSVIAGILDCLMKEKDVNFTYLNIGIDAFHFHNDVLDEKNLRKVKGRYDTYDLDLLFEKLSAFKAGNDVSFPYYSRKEHNPVPDKFLVSEEDVFLFLEGQWVLRNTPDWKKVRALTTYNMLITGPIENLRKNVIYRHMQGGRTEEDATNFYTTSDLPNTEEVLNNSVKPDREIMFYKDI